MNPLAQPQSDPFRPLDLAELRAGGSAATHWHWDGYVAAGNSTLLTSRWKAGKTTLLSVLIARLHAGGELAGRAVRPGRVVVVSEESPEHWLARSERVSFGSNVSWLCRPFAGRPTRDDWRNLIDALAARRPDLVVIDPLASFLPGRSENDSATVLEALLPLQKLLAGGSAVLVLHHPRKGASAPGQAARGSGALAGWADVLIEMERPAGTGEEDRRRVLHGFSRHAETPRRWVVELSADGTDYRAAADDDAGPDPLAATEDVMIGLLEDASRKLTRLEMLADLAGRLPAAGRRDAVAVAGKGRDGGSCAQGGVGADEERRSATGCRRPRSAGGTTRCGCRT